MKSNINCVSEILTILTDIKQLTVIS